jgi:hypothetical protein
MLLSYGDFSYCILPILDRVFEKWYLRIRQLPEGSWVNIWKERNLRINADPQNANTKKAGGLNL